MMNIIAQHVSSHSPIEFLPSRGLDLNVSDIDLVPPLRVALGVREGSLVLLPVSSCKAGLDLASPASVTIVGWGRSRFSVSFQKIGYL
jgi:hypothetical protein